LSIAHYADEVINYLHDNGFEYAEPDAKGGTFPGGILMDLGGGQRVAFFLPSEDHREAVKSLEAYLDEVYPGRHQIDLPAVKADYGRILRAHVRVDAASSYDDAPRPASRPHDDHLPVLADGAAA
jgi:hypothetical protein